MTVNKEDTAISLGELLRLNFSEPISWLSDVRRNETRINWVVISLEEGDAGDLLLIRREDFTCGVSKQAQEMGIAAILLLGEAAQQVGSEDFVIPIAVVGAEGDLRYTQRELLNILIDRQAASTERGMKIHFQLSKLAAEGQKIEGVIRAMLELTGKGILIQDKRLNTLAEIPSQELQPIWGSISDLLSSPDHLPASLRNRKHAGQQNMILSQSIPGGMARLIVPISVGDVARGYLSLIGMDGEFDTLDRLTAEEGALVCAIEMARAKAVRETEKRLQADLLTALLQEDLSPRDAGLWVQTMGLDQTQEHAAMQFAWVSPSPPSRRRLETLVNGEVQRTGALVFLTTTGSNVICFCQVPPNRPRPELALELAAGVLDRAKLEYPTANLRCGIGSQAADLNQWQNSFREAGVALEMACRLEKDVPLYYPDLLVYHLLMLVEQDPLVTKLQEDTIGPLLGDGDLIDTLEAYYDHQGNLSQAAEALFIHRNTLSYRLDKIGKLTGLDMSNPDVALAVQIALKIHRMTASGG